MVKKYYKPLIILTVIILLASLIKGAGLAPVASAFPEGEVAKLTEITGQNWTVQESGTNAYYTIPEQASAALVLEITSNWNSIQVYLEDELLYSFQDEYHELGRVLHWIDIPAGSGGKRIILTASDSESVAEVMQSVSYLGTADAIRHHFFMKNLPTLLLAVVDLMMAGIVILIFTVLRHRLSLKLVRGMGDLFAFIVLNGIWLISDSNFLECFTGRTGLWALISYIAFMLMPVFLVRFARQLLAYRGKLLQILAMVSLGLTSASLLLYLTRLAPISTLLVCHQAMVILDAAVVFSLCNYEIRHYRARKLIPIRTGAALMGICEVLTILMYWHGMNDLYPLLYGAGFTCYVVCLTILVVKQAYYNIGKKVEMDTYRDLAYKDVMTKVYNRSAFMQYQRGAGNRVRESAYILFDINDLKLVNDTRGHQRGDDLIIRAASCIRETFEEVGSCYRIGGDEFMVVLGNIHDAREVQSLLWHFEKQVAISNQHLTKNQVELSIAYGYSLAGTELRSGVEMYKEADERMYSKKRMMKVEV